MSQLIQTLEQRMLMSVTALTLSTDVSNVKNDSATLVSVHTTRYSAAKGAIETIVADLKSLDTKSNRAANNKLAAKLIAVGDASHAKIVADLDVFISVAKTESTADAATGDALLKHPTSTALQHLVAKEVVKLNADVADKLTALNNELSTATTDLDNAGNAIAAANPSLATLISNDETSLATKTTNLSNAAAQVQTDTTQLGVDLSAITT